MPTIKTLKLPAKYKDANFVPISVVTKVFGWSTSTTYRNVNNPNSFIRACVRKVDGKKMIDVAALQRAARIHIVSVA